MADRSLTDEELQERVAHLDGLLERLEQVATPGSEIALEAIETLTEIYGAALGRLVALLGRGTATVQDAADDELVGHLMVLHGLHPDPAEARIARALDEVRPGLGDRGDVSLTGIDDGVARVEVTVGGCPSTASAMASSVADVVLAAAPELAGVEPVTARPASAPAVIPVESLLHRARP